MPRLSSSRSTAITTKQLSSIDLCPGGPQALAGPPCFCRGLAGNTEAGTLLKSDAAPERLGSRFAHDRTHRVDVVADQHWRNDARRRRLPVKDGRRKERY